MLRLESILEQSGDKPRLVDTLEYHTRYAGSANEKLLISKRIAGLLQSDLHDFEKAIPYWERVVKGLPGDEQAIEALLEAYHHLGRNEDLARTLDLKVHAHEGQPAIQAEALRHLARLAGEALRQTDRAKAAWEALVLRQPADRESLEALSRIAASTSDFAALASLLDRRIPIADSRADATALALERARIFEEDLKDLPAAIVTLERIISEMDPSQSRRASSFAPRGREHGRLAQGGCGGRAAAFAHDRSQGSGGCRPRARPPLPPAPGRFTQGRARLRACAGHG